MIEPVSNAAGVPGWQLCSAYLCTWTLDSKQHIIRSFGPGTHVHLETWDHLASWLKPQASECGLVELAADGMYTHIQ